MNVDFRYDGVELTIEPELRKFGIVGFANCSIEGRSSPVMVMLFDSGPSEVSIHYPVSVQAPTLPDWLQDPEMRNDIERRVHQAVCGREQIDVETNYGADSIVSVTVFRHAAPLCTPGVVGYADVMLGVHPRPLQLTLVVDSLRKLRIQWGVTCGEIEPRRAFMSEQLQQAIRDAIYRRIRDWPELNEATAS